MNKLTLVTIVLIAFPSIARSGASSWAFEISDWKRESDTRATLTLKYVGTSPERPFSCESLTILVDYKPEYFRKTWTGTLTDKKRHIEALNWLAGAHTKRERIRFGAYGLGESNEGKCTFKSRALAILKENDGESAVYSFFHPI